MRRPLAVLASLTVALSSAACGDQVGGSQPASTSGPSRQAQHPAWVADPSGQVACSTGALPARGHDLRLQTRLGEATATLEGRMSGDRYLPSLSGPRLTLQTAAGSTSTPLPAVRQADGGVATYVPAQLRLDSHVHGYLCLARFAGSSPTALLQSYSGGAHCCTTVRLVDATGRVFQRNTGNVGASLQATSDGVLLRTGDDTFNYAFADFADSCAPVLLLLPRDGRLHDVTRQHPDVLQDDAQRAWHFAQQREVRTGFLACWAADQDRLGADAKVWRVLESLRLQGKLRLPRDLTQPGYWKDGVAYIAQLRQFLTQRGYRSG